MRNYSLVYKFSMDLQLCLAYTGGLVGVGNKDMRMNEELALWVAISSPPHFPAAKSREVKKRQTELEG